MFCPLFDKADQKENMLNLSELVFFKIFPKGKRWAKMFLPVSVCDFVCLLAKYLSHLCIIWDHAKHSCYFFFNKTPLGSKLVSKVVGSMQSFKGC